MESREWRAESRRNHTLPSALCSLLSALCSLLSALCDDRQVARAAELAGLEAPPLPPFAVRPLARGALILNFSGYDEMAVRSAAGRLSDVLREVIDHSATRQALGA